MESLRTTIGIVGAGPAGLMLGNLLLDAGIDCLILERSDGVDSGARAGVIEHRTARLLDRYGLADGFRVGAKRPSSCEFRGPDGSFQLAFEELTNGRSHYVYPQNLLVNDLTKAYLGKGGQIMVVNPESSAKSVQDFLAMAKQEPGKLSFGSGSSSSRIAGELLQQMADVKLLHVPYKSNPMAVTDLLGGQISMMITDMATGLPQVQSGKLRAWMPVRSQ